MGHIANGCVAGPDPQSKWFIQVNEDRFLFIGRITMQSLGKYFDFRYHPQVHLTTFPAEGHKLLRVCRSMGDRKESGTCCRERSDERHLILAAVGIDL